MIWWRHMECLLHRWSGCLLVLLLAIQTALLTTGAFRNGPVVDELGHFPAGLSHLKYRKFDLYRVNPPLIRTVAAIPILFTDCVEDWHGWQSDPRQREEFDVGRAFVAANGSRFFQLVSLSRLACIPFSLIGTCVCYLWARELAGRRAGLVAAFLWVVAPNMLAHGSLMTPDAGASAMGLLAAWQFRKWLRKPGWKSAAFAGLTLGLAELTKTTWLVLFLLWPVLFFVIALARRRRVAFRVRHIGQLTLLCLIALYVLNAGYLFQGSMKPLGEYQFQSQWLSGNASGIGNRFAGSVVDRLPVPVPAMYLHGIDLQKKDFETGQPSYLRGEWRSHGWWYYYGYALLVKLPAGMLVAGVLALFLLLTRQVSGFCMEDLALFAPAAVIFALASSQIGLNKHLRYVLPVLPCFFIATAVVVGQLRRPRARLLRMAFAALFFWTAGSSLSVWPISLTYFNEFAGGPAQGDRHLLGSNLDWGQGVRALHAWDEQRTDSLPLFVSCDVLYDPADTGIRCRPVPLNDSVQPPGWYAISVNRLHNNDEIRNLFAGRSPELVLDNSIRVYRVRDGQTPMSDAANRL